MIFEQYVYLKEKALFNSYGIGDQELELIKELIDHDLPSESESNIAAKKFQPAGRRFLYEVK